MRELQTASTDFGFTGRERDLRLAFGALVAGRSLESFSAATGEEAAAIQRVLEWVSGRLPDRQARLAFAAYCVRCGLSLFEEGDVRQAVAAFAQWSAGADTAADPDGRSTIAGSGGGSSISAEPATTAPATGAAPPAPADGPTLKALQARFRELGFTDKHRVERLAFASRILARAVESFKDLSSDERRVTMRVAGYLGKHLPDVLDFASFAEAMGLELSSNQAVRAALAEYASAQTETADG